jgi:hypothetical protein
MFKNRKALVLCCAVLVGLPASWAGGKKSPRDDADRAKTTKPASTEGVLWENPADISSRNLFYGPGGKEHEPHPGFTYLEEDLHGSNPKFDVRDRDGVKWRVKLGMEAQPETVATRLVWAAGYFANEDYFLPEARVDQMQKLKRWHANSLIGLDGSIHNARLKRMEEEKKQEEWKWKDNPFSGARELNGLRVMMALINNWDLATDNNGVYRVKHHHGSEDGPAEYLVSDLGASFGAPGMSWLFSQSKGNLHAYTHSKFITHATPDYVDFQTPGHPAFWDVFRIRDFWARWFEMPAVCRRIPRADAKWMGQILAQLSADQIRDAFRAGGYSPEDAGAFTTVVLRRIADLNQL